MRKRILVAIDDSDGSRGVAGFVNSFFDSMEVDVIALHVAEGSIRQAFPLGRPAEGTWLTYPAGAGYTLASPPRPRTAGDVIGRSGERTVKASGVEADRIEVDVGDPVAAIERVAEEEAVALIVIGASHRTWLDRLLVAPSVARTLAKDAPRPVLIVH